jgi:hypothetical protein
VVPASVVPASVVVSSVDVELASVSTETSTRPDAEVPMSLAEAE